MTPDASGPLDPAALWRRYDAVEARLTAPVSERMLELAALGAGQRVLDLATGRGEPALRAARRVGPGGAVLGLEPDERVAALARAAAAAAGLTTLEVRVAPAEEPGPLPVGHFHAVTARWGLMYMADPVAALRHARRALRADGRLVAALWAEPARVPWRTLPRTLLARHVEVPPLDFEAPGVFRLAHLERVARDLAAAGFSVERVEEMETPVFAADTPEAVVAWARALGLAAPLEERPEALAAWRTDLAAAVAAAAPPAGTVTPDERYALGGVTRLVLACPAAESAA